VVLNEESSTRLYQINLQNGELSSAKNLNIVMPRGFAVGLGF
jgi:hypothetical protein